MWGRMEGMELKQKKRKPGEQPDLRFDESTPCLFRKLVERSTRSLQ